MHISPTAAPIIPGPRPLPVLGSAGNFIAFLSGPRAYLERLHAQHGPIAAIARGSSRYVFVFSPRYTQQLLSDTALFHNLDAASSPVRMPPGSALSRLYNGLTNINGARHARLRRLMAPAFGRTRIESYRDPIAALVEQCVAGWRRGAELELFGEMRELTLAIAVRVLLGLDPGGDGAAVSRLLARWMALVFSVPALALPLALPGLPYRQLLRASEQLDGLIRSLVARRRALATPGSDILALLIAARDENGDALSDDELIGQTAFLFMAGHSTTSSVLSWTLLLLAQHPPILHDLLDELDGALGGDAPSTEQLRPESGALPLLEDVIKESMRLLPSVIWWSRVSTAPCAFGPYEIPAGAHVAYSAYVTHRLPELYDAPRRFRPDRWRTLRPGPYEYLPFAAGPRACLGAQLAMVELKLALAIILQRARLTLRPHARVDYGGLMLSQPHPGLPMHIAAPDRRLTRSPLRGNLATLVDWE